MSENYNNESSENYVYSADNWCNDNITWVKNMQQTDIWNRKLVCIRKELISTLARAIIPLKISHVDEDSTKLMEALYEDLYKSSLDKLLDMAKDNNVFVDKIIDRHRFFK
jgi:hypothetical protein